MEGGKSKTHTWAKFDTEFTSDAVEFCPISGFTHVAAVGTYQLIKTENESKNSQPGESSEEDEVKSKPARRIGRLYMMQVDFENKKLDDSIKSVDGAAILDLKWNHDRNDDNPILGSANADGTIVFYRLDRDEKDDISVETIHSCDKNKENVLCLSIDWSNRCNSNIPCIAVSQSDGTILILKARDGDLWQIDREWKAHDLEAWISSFNYHETNILYTGADDCKFKSWDLRMDGSFPSTVNKSHNAGVCSIQSNPFSGYVLATGSYDETVRIWDTRSLRSPTKEFSVGGGVWRLKWHPEMSNILLSASMHAGFHVLDVQNDKDIELVVDYTQHESLAYGADWCYDKKVLGSGKRPLIGTSSFYDHSFHLWEFNW
ncbi:Diphthine methyltransferase [Nowakowskiella sp. JEL0407]|nr:Diphthine methyltransferase [Nowakowskiella sp. JEL0407]